MTKYQRAWMTWGPQSCVLDGTPYGHSYSLAIPDWLPDPLEIVGAELSIQSMPFGPGTNCKAMLKLDRGGRFHTSTGGWPGSELPINGDTLYNAGLFRLVICEMLPGYKRHDKNAFDPPVIASASRGDRIQVDIAGTGGHVFQPCPTIYFLADEEWEMPGAPEAPEPPPPPLGDVMGNWASSSAAARTLNGTPNGCQYGGFRFQVPSGVTTLAQLGVNVTAAYVSGDVHMEVWSDSSGSPGTKLGESSAQSITTTGEKTFAVPLTVTPASYLWAVIVQENAASSIEYQTVASSNISARGNTITAFASNNLPSSEQWRVKVS